MVGKKLDSEKKAEHKWPQKKERNGVKILRWTQFFYFTEQQINRYKHLNRASKEIFWWCAGNAPLDMNISEV